MSSQQDTEVSLWLLSLHDVDIGASSFGATFRLVFVFDCPDLEGYSIYKSVGERNYYLPSDFTDILPALELEILNSKSGGVGNNQFYKESVERGLLFTETNSGPNKLIYELKCNGTFRQNFDIRKFPYESEQLKIELVFWRANTADYERAWVALPGDHTSPGGDNLSLPDYEVGKSSIALVGEKTFGENIRAEISIPTIRQPWFYVKSSSLSLLIITAFSLSTFGLAPDQSGTAIGIICSLLLAAIAVKFVIAQDIPRVPYATTVDKEAISTYVFLLFSAFLWTDQNSIIPSNYHFAAAALGACCIAFLIVLPIGLFLIRRMRFRSGAALTS